MDIETHFIQKSARLWVTLRCLAGVSALGVAVSSFPTACKRQRCHIHVFFFFLLWIVHPPPPSRSLAVISFISCGHVSPAVLTQGASSRGLNPHRLPFTKNRRDHLNEGIVCRPFNSLISAVTYQTL